MRIIINDGKDVIITSKKDFCEFLEIMESEDCVAILIEIKGYTSLDVHPVNEKMNKLEEELRKLKES